MRFRSRSAFCDCLWLGRLGHSATAFPPNAQPPFLPALRSLLPSSYQGFTRLLNHLNNQQKNKFNSIDEDHVRSSQSFWSDSQFWRGLLKYPAPIFAWRRTDFDLFSFSRWRNRHKTKPHFRRFEVNKSVQPDLGPPSRIFALAFFTETGQWPQPQSQKRMTKLKTLLFSSPKSPIRERLKKHIHNLEMLKANLPKSENNPKNSAKVNRLFLIWETMERLKPQKFGKLWTLYFWFGTCCSRLGLLTFFSEIGQWPQPQSQNRRTRLKVAFVFMEKSPNQRAVSWTHSLFGIVEGISSQKWSKPKIQKK